MKSVKVFLGRRLKKPINGKGTLRLINNVQNTNLKAFIAGEYLQTAAPVVYAAILKRFNGSTWVKEPLKRYNGVSFVTAVLKVFKSGTWQTVDTTGA